MGIRICITILIFRIKKKKLIKKFKKPRFYGRKVEALGMQRGFGTKTLQTKITFHFVPLHSYFMSIECSFLKFFY